MAQPTIRREYASITAQQNLALTGAVFGYVGAPQLILSLSGEVPFDLNTNTFHAGRAARSSSSSCLMRFSASRSCADSTVGMPGASPRSTRACCAIGTGCLRRLPDLGRRWLRADLVRGSDRLRAPGIAVNTSSARAEILPSKRVGISQPGGQNLRTAHPGISAPPCRYRCRRHRSRPCMPPPAPQDNHVERYVGDRSHRDLAPHESTRNATSYRARSAVGDAAQPGRCRPVSAQPFVGHPHIFREAAHCRCNRGVLHRSMNPAPTALVLRLISASA